MSGPQQALAKVSVIFMWMDGITEEGTPQAETISYLCLKSLLVLFSVCLTVFNQDIKTRLFSHKEVGALGSEKNALLLPEASHMTFQTTESSEYS